MFQVPTLRDGSSVILNEVNHGRRELSLLLYWSVDLKAGQAENLRFPEVLRYRKTDWPCSFKEAQALLPQLLSSATSWAELGMVCGITLG